MHADPTALMDRAAGCLLGGALGDALGAPVEFLHLSEIHRRHGRGGITEPPSPALLTDDTQLTLFTTEGLLHSRADQHGFSWPTTAVWRACRRWLRSQQQDEPDPDARGLLADPRVYASRAPGLTCLRALQHDEMGTIEQPCNDSRGCGGLAHSAPLGFSAHAELAYRHGCETAALTHGHPGGWAPGGALALIVHLVAVQDRPLWEAVDQATGRVLADDEETGLALAEARRLAVADLRAESAAEGGPSAASVERLGEGWLAPEALAIAVYAALVRYKPSGFREALLLAANHSGDSDTTAALTGNLLGAAHGTGALPRAWLNRLELAEVIAQLGKDLGAACAGVDFEPERYRLIA
ncbi:ADP-ribosylglycohydrolase family protein [Streptoalloteichus tenebrarius]|uniref:ADP-ribosylglycohydrolase family protein n=1 Tax=Streptoalloteichus tenebrarius (strain ATCC 17920 / DSM 40477 / JCM 4838 / CBS 697.72 / NBRC 16177 / NCIMB 11028 / NRRL B-12390 / A12253. 1 / ISP 5477) TaxID=1933 RepID=UPI0020A5EB66|nr:ADP-ribosylglycohydrolase family protein [Streptoalloteichus tenebrarius]